jgi:hypothetical protein
LPQGFLKKIEFQLLLADLPFERRDPTLRKRQIVKWGRDRHSSRSGGQRRGVARLDR